MHDGSRAQDVQVPKPAGRSIRRYFLHPDPHLRHYGMGAVRHPQVGTIDLDFDTLTVPDQEQQVVIFTAEPDSPAYRSLQLLKVIGTQRMTAAT